MAKSVITVLHRFACVLRGHRWKTVEDGGGAISWCTRCGRQRHSRSVRADIHYRTHVNLAYEVEMREGPADDACRAREGYEHDARDV